MAADRQDGVAARERDEEFDAKHGAYATGDPMPASVAEAPDAARSPEEALAQLRQYVVGSEVPVALVRWMERVELQLAALRAQSNEIDEVLRGR